MQRKSAEKFFQIHFNVFIIYDISYTDNILHKFNKRSYMIQVYYSHNQVFFITLRDSTAEVNVISFLILAFIFLLHHEKILTL